MSTFLVVALSNVHPMKMAVAFGAGDRRMTLEAAVGLLDLNRRFLLLSLDVWLQEAFDQKII